VFPRDKYELFKADNNGARRGFGRGQVTLGHAGGVHAHSSNEFLLWGFEAFPRETDPTQARDPIQSPKADIVASSRKILTPMAQTAIQVKKAARPLTTGGGGVYFLKQESRVIETGNGIITSIAVNTNGQLVVFTLKPPRSQVLCRQRSRPTK